MGMFFEDARGASIFKGTQKDWGELGRFIANLRQHDLSEDESEALDAAITKLRSQVHLHKDHLEKIIHMGTRRRMRKPKLEPKYYDKASPDPEDHALRWFWEELENPKRQRGREQREQAKSRLEQAESRVVQLQREIASKDELIASKDELIRSLRDAVASKDELIAILKLQHLQGADSAGRVVRMDQWKREPLS